MMRARRIALAVTATVVLAGCSSSSSSGTGTGTGTDAGTAAVADASDAASGATSGIPASCNGDEGGSVPTTPSELQTWLNERHYQCWAHESVAHASTGPHSSGEVKTFLNAKLDASMRSAGENAEGSVAVKEFYAKGGTEITGWAVSVKTQAGSANGQGLYWYEVFGVTPAASTIQGQGMSLCVNCHSAGKDYVLIPYPLR